MPHRLCRVPYCRGTTSSASAGHYCSLHWRKLPADLRTRLRWAVDEEESVELDAALAATDEVLS